ncbi:MAG: DNA repair protein RadC [Candidatus Omnitrophota bacterium]
MISSQKSTSAIPTWPEEDRPREKLLKNGEHTLSDSELLAILLRTGTKGQSAIDLARKILHKFKSFRKMSHTDKREWTEFKGLGMAKIAQLRAALEIARRFNYYENNSVKKPMLQYTEEVVDMFKARMRDLKYEVFKVILCDTKNRILDVVEIAQGTPVESYPIIREIISKALQSFAAGIICVHNHPQGEPEPSKDDELFTTQLRQTCKPMGIRLLDHIIFGTDEFYSFDKNCSNRYSKIC